MAITVTAWKKDGTGYWIKGDPIVETVADIPGGRWEDPAHNVHGAAPPENVMRSHDFPKPPAQKK